MIGIKVLSIYFSSLSMLWYGVLKDDTRPLTFPKAVVWAAGENDMQGFRIPGIVVSKQGHVLAFAEARADYSDEAPKSLVLKRSEDGGKTWSENIFIEKSDGSFWAKNPAQIDPQDVSHKKEVWTNPAPVVDEQTGRIFIFYALSEGAVAGQNLQRYTRIFYKYSDDDGLSWSARTEITTVINGEENPGRKDQNGFPCDALGRAFHMPGPGHGIQLANGRLLLQVWSRTAIAGLNGSRVPVHERKYGVAMLFSDDHGATWELGEPFGHEGQNVNESRMVELEDGNVYLNARYVNNEPGEKNNYRMTATSDDRGESWKNLKIDRQFPLSNPCDAGLTSLQYQGKQLMLYSKNESLHGRKRLMIRVSFDRGKHWPVAKLIDEGPAGYSDMAVLAGHAVLLLYETGRMSPVYCMRVSVNDLLESD